MRVLVEISEFSVGFRKEIALKHEDLGVLSHFIEGICHEQKKIHTFHEYSDDFSCSLKLRIGHFFSGYSA